MIETAKMYGTYGAHGSCVGVMANRIRAWQDAGEWLPTEQHKTVGSMLVELDRRLDVGEAADKTVLPWLEAGKPGLPKPVDPYGPEITGDFGGRCPVEDGEKIWMRDYTGVIGWGENQWGYGLPAGRCHWTGPRTFRRLKADHPGDSYWHGKRERIAEHGPAGLDVNDRIVTENPGPGVVWQRVRSISLRVGMPFRRWLKGGT
jgi:hypothetical protein